MAAAGKLSSAGEGRLPGPCGPGDAGRCCWRKVEDALLVFAGGLTLCALAPGGEVSPGSVAGVSSAMDA